MKLLRLDPLIKASLLLCFASLSSPSYAYPVILDSDFTINSFIYFVNHEDTDLKAITIACSGEAHCEPGKNNAISVLDLLEDTPTIPVASGDAYPLDGYFVFPAQWRQAIDNIGSTNVINSVPKNIQLAPPSYAPSKLSAVELIHKTISISPEPVTIVADGPLTNIAQWLLSYPDDINHVSKLVIMGGALDARGNIIVKGFTDGHPNLKAEWNFLVDPLSVQIVFDSPLKNIVLVPLDATNHLRVTHRYAEQFDQQANTAVAEFISNTYKNNSEFIASGEYYFWDELTDMIATNPDLCVDAELTPLQVKVDYVSEPNYLGTSDLSMPETRWDGKPRSHIKAETAGVISRSETGRAITVCKNTDPEKAFKLLTNTLAK